MQYKLITTAAIVATALAAPSPVNTDSSDLYDDTSDYNSLLLDYLNPPTSIRSVLATAIPSSFYMDMLDPASMSSVLNEVSAGNFPAWYSSLPSDVKAWATTVSEEQVASASPTTSNEALVTASEVLATSTSPITAASQTGSTAVETSPASSVSSTVVTGTSSASASSSQSTGGAPRPTGGVVAGVAGAAGVLALALGL